MTDKKPDFTDNDISSQLVKLLSADDRIGRMDGPIQVEGTPKIHVKKDNGDFRSRTLLHTQEFFYLGCRMGKRNDLIFQFTPVDSQDYQYAEIPLVKVDEVFPYFATSLDRAFRTGATTTDNIIAEIMLPMIVEMEERRNAEEDRKLEALKLKQADEEKTKNLSTFGMF